MMHNRKNCNSGLDKMTEKSAPDEGHSDPTLQELAKSSGTVTHTAPMWNPGPDRGGKPSGGETQSTESQKHCEYWTHLGGPKVQKAKSIVSSEPIGETQSAESQKHCE